MNRIDRIFKDLRNGASQAVGPGKALMPYLTAGDPDLAGTAALLAGAEQAGAAICEVGIPYSDPIADGPVIQASMTYALNKGLHVDQIFSTVAAIRPQVELGLVAMVSYSLVHRLGLKRFVASAKEAGFDGFIFPDLPMEASQAAADMVREAGMILSLLIAPQTSAARARRIAEASSGFVYVLSRSGLTGEQTSLPTTLPKRLNDLRQVTDLPLAVGFGISSPQQVQQVVAVADAAIVGSAIVRRVAENRDLPNDKLVAVVSGFVGELAGGLEGV